MSKESKKYANPVRKAKYKDDGVKVSGGRMIGLVIAYEKAMYKDDRPTLKLHQFVKPETKDAPIKLFREPGRKPAPPAPPSLPKAKEVKPHSRPPKGMKNPVTVKSGTLKRGKKKK